MSDRTLRSNTQQKQYAKTLLELSQTPLPTSQKLEIKNKKTNSSQGTKRVRTKPQPVTQYARRPNNNRVQENMFPLETEFVFKVMDSVHDIFDRPGVANDVLKLFGTQHGNGTDKENRFCELVFGFNKLVNNSLPTHSISGSLTHVQKKQKQSVVHGASNNTIKFKEWMKHYLEINSASSVPLKMLKEEWKIKIFDLAQGTQWAFLTMGVTSPWLAYLKGATDRTLTKKVTASYISAYDILLATDALKTNDQLKTEQNRSTLALPKLARNVGKFDVSKNYICNMAQIIDPANNINMNKPYRFAFPPMIDITSTDFVRAWFVRTTGKYGRDSRIYQLATYNMQFNSNFRICIEIHNPQNKNALPNPIIELQKHAKSVTQGDLLTSEMIQAKDFFKYVRVFVLGMNDGNTFIMAPKEIQPFVSVRGLCVQTDQCILSGKVSPNAFKIHNKLSGFSVTDVVGFMKTDVTNMKNALINKNQDQLRKYNSAAVQKKIKNYTAWLIGYYLDWKRMGDSFQITHLKDLMLANQRLVAQATNNAQRTRLYHPYHFISIDILAIVQCIMNGVHFIYEKSDNAYVIGNNIMTNNQFTKYQIVKKDRIDKNIQKQENLIQMYNAIENATGTLMNLSNNTNQIRTHRRKLTRPKQAVP
jgi:hypothetical protein